MERINNKNTSEYIPSDVLISIREPYDKNTLWIYPKRDSVEVKIFYNKQWKTLFNSKDEGLSKVSNLQVTNYIKENKDLILDFVKTLMGKANSNINYISSLQEKLEAKLNIIESKLDKLINKYSTLINIANGKE